MIDIKTINELGQIIRGVTYKPSDASTKFIEDYIPVLRAGNIKNGRIIFSDFVYVKPERIKDIQRIQKGDVVIAASTGSKKVIGKAAQIDENWDGSFGGFCIAFRPNIKLIDPKYFGYFFQSKFYRKKISHMSSGANINNLKKDHFDRLKIPLPALEDQKRIAKSLDKADALRQKRKQEIGLLDDYLKSVFLEMFGDPKINPKEFPLVELQELYIDKKNGTKCGPFGSALKKGEFVNDGIPVWNMDNISTTGQMVMPFRMWITPEKYSSLEAYSVIDGDVIISRAGTVGKMCVAKTDEGKSIISTNLIRVRLGEKLLPLYFVSLMNYCKTRLGRLKTGADGAFTHMSTGVLDNLTFPYPPLDLQNKFAKNTALVESIKQKMIIQAEELDNQFQALMQKVFQNSQ